MKRRANVVPVPDGNATKYFSYREAWGRIRRARGHGFYLEAVTLEESIIADRLISYLVCVGPVPADRGLERKSFGHLVDLWMKTVPEPIPTKHFPDLRTAVDEWRRRRNKVVHGMVKSVPGSAHEEVLDFLEEAKLVALQGDALAIAIADWGKRMKKRPIKGRDRG
jgi:hypothetical protein